MQLNWTFDHMTDVSMNVQLCEVSSVNGISQHKNPALVKNVMEDIRLYTEGQSKCFAEPESCDAALLDKDTGTQDAEDTSWFKALIASGLITQMILKPIYSFFVTALIGYLEPFAMYRGKVEMFGLDTATGEDLTEKETNFVRAYARDTHLFGLLIASILMGVEIVLLIFLSPKLIICVLQHISCANKLNKW